MRGFGGTGETTAESGRRSFSCEATPPPPLPLPPPPPPPPLRDLRQRTPLASVRVPPPSSSSPLPPPPLFPANRGGRRRVLFSGDALEREPTTPTTTPTTAAVHTVHVQVPVAVAVAAEPTSINMSLRVDMNIRTTSTSSSTSNTSSTTTTSTNMAKSHHSVDMQPVPPSSISSSSSSAVVMPAPPVATAGAAALPSPRASSRKRKGIAFGNKRSSSSSKEKDSLERQGSAASSSDVHTQQPTPGEVSGGGGGGGGGGAPQASGSRSKSPFEKLNTLKMLLDCGHLTQEEYQERKTQIINEMTGTSTSERKKSAAPRRVLQPIMKTVVPHQPPDFSRIPKERAEKLSFDVNTLDWQATSTRIKLDLVPFATGQLRNAYFLQELPPQHGSHGSEGSEAPHLFVAKFSIRDAEPSSYLSDVEMQAVCAHYAELYNEHEPPLKVYYASSWLLKLRDRGDAVVCSVEEYLPGAYVKYSNNNGYVGKETSTTEERERNTPHAFSHFTFVASDYRLMVVDIQGVDDSYTDPQIHTADGRGFGAGNLGTFGMEKFLETHRCNQVCRWLGLKSLHKEYKAGGTAAPAYRMPFGEKIKKSTNRITEERNTFSRSVTVSEAFGGELLRMSEMLQAAVVEQEEEDEEDHGQEQDRGNNRERDHGDRQDDQARDYHETSLSSSVSTGSSSLLYGQGLFHQPQHPSFGGLPPHQSKNPFGGIAASDANNRLASSLRISPQRPIARRGKSFSRSRSSNRRSERHNQTNDEPSMLWLLLKRLLCCCQEGW